MEMEYSSSKMAHFIKESGGITNKMDLDYMNGAQSSIIQEAGVKVANMDTGS